MKENEDGHLVKKYEQKKAKLEKVKSKLKSTQRNLDKA